MNYQELLEGCTSPHGKPYYPQALTHEQREEMHRLSFEGLSEQATVITRRKHGEEMIQNLQEVLNRFHEQVATTHACGLHDIPQEYEARLKWFDAILEKTIEARTLYKNALELATNTERNVVVKKIRNICRKFESLMRAVHGKGNPECAKHIKLQLGWFNDLIDATLKGESMTQPSPA